MFHICEGDFQGSRVIVVYGVLVDMAMVVGRRELKVKRMFGRNLIVSHSQTQKEFSTLLFQALKDAHYSPVMDELDGDELDDDEDKIHQLQLAELDSIVILVLSNEFFMSKRLMIALNKFAKAQLDFSKFAVGVRSFELVSDKKLNVLPVLLDMSFTEFDNNVREKKWLESWKDIKASQWQQALSIIYDNVALSYEDEGHPEFIKKVVEATLKFWKPEPPNPGHECGFKQWVSSVLHQLDDEVHNTSYKVPSTIAIVREQNFAREPQGTWDEVVLNTILLHEASNEAPLHTFDKLAIRHLDMGEALGVGKVDIVEKLVKYFEIIEGCEEGVQKMETLKFNKAQCEYLAIKLQTTVEIARLFLYTCQTQPNKMYSIRDVERWVEIFKLLLVLSKQVEGFFQDCSKNAWMQAAMTLANVREYVSTIGFNLELCKIGLCKGESVAENYALEDVGELNDREVLNVAPRVFDDKEFLLSKAIEVSYSTNFEDAKLAKYLLVKLRGDIGDPNIDDENSNVLKMVFESFEYVKNICGIVQQIGKGASAKVYKVMWFDTPVAKKTFLEFNNPEFLQEAKVLAQLHHPNVSSMFCCNMTQRVCSIIMELMDGSLYDLLQKRTTNSGYFHRFSNLEEVDLMLQVGHGVNYLHQQRIVHRDLKSDNILVKGVEIPNVEIEYVQAKVMDFGLSKTKETSTSYSNMTYNVGTSRWMAPEIIKLREDMDLVYQGSRRLCKYNFKGDVYSFGMVCYEILTGEVPFQSEGSERGVKMMVLNGLRPTLPEHCYPRLAKLIQKCWSGEPQVRPSMNEVCLELKSIKYLLLIGEDLELA